MTLMPREHGAYGQLAFPLLTALLLSGATLASVAWILTVVAGFIAHEPVQVLLGRRGARALRERRREATLAAGFFWAVAIGSGTLALLSAPEDVRWSFMLPLVPAFGVVAAVMAGREKSAVGELAVALTFSVASVPAMLSAGATPLMALAVSLVFGIIFVVSTLAVRSVVLGVRGGGHPAAVRASRIGALGVSLAAFAGLWLASRHELVPVTVLAAVSPALAFAMGVIARPPRASALRLLGWSIISVATFATATLVIGLVD